eukprot:COSAG01_NODE_537_length_15764_cov_54.273795_11_plen_391_part_00
MPTHTRSRSSPRGAHGRSCSRVCTSTPRSCCVGPSPPPPAAVAATSAVATAAAAADDDDDDDGDDDDIPWNAPPLDTLAAASSSSSRNQEMAAGATIPGSFIEMLDDPPSTRLDRLGQVGGLRGGGQPSPVCRWSLVISQHDGIVGELQVKERVKSSEEIFRRFGTSNLAVSIENPLGDSAKLIRARLPGRGASGGGGRSGESLFHGLKFVRYGWRESEHNISASGWAVCRDLDSDPLRGRAWLSRRRRIVVPGGLLTGGLGAEEEEEEDELILLDVAGTPVPVSNGDRLLLSAADCPSLPGEAHHHHHSLLRDPLSKAEEDNLGGSSGSSRLPSVVQGVVRLELRWGTYKQGFCGMFSEETGGTGTAEGGARVKQRSAGAAAATAASRQ